MTLTPLTTILRRTLELIKKLDKHCVFMEPVRAEDVPDYYEIIKRPMDFTTMVDKIDRFEYESIQAFEADINLIIDNALLYNKPDTVYARLALKIRSQVPQLITNARTSYEQLHIDPRTGILKRGIPSHLLEYPSLHPRHLLPPHQIPIIQPPPPGKIVELEQMENDETATVQRVAESSETDEKEDAESENKPDPDLAPLRERTPSPALRRSSSRLTSLASTELPRTRSMSSIGSQKRVYGEPAPEYKTKRVKTMDKPSPPTSLSKNTHALDDDAIKSLIEQLKKERGRRNLGALVWARMKGMPWQPAEEKEGKEAPPGIAKENDQKRLVCVFDKDMKSRRTWVWLTEDCIQPFDFGEEDEHHLRGVLRMKSSLRNQVFLGYKIACLTRGKDPENTLSSVLK